MDYFHLLASSSFQAASHFGLVSYQISNKHTSNVPAVFGPQSSVCWLCDMHHERWLLWNFSNVPGV